MKTKPTSFAKAIVWILAVLFIILFAICAFLLRSSDFDLLPPRSETPPTTETIPTEPRETLPFYITQEAERVASVVKSHQTNHSFSFLAISDTHECADNSAANRQVGQAAALLRQTVDIDFAALLGDIASGTSSSTIDEGIHEIQTVSEYLEEAFSGIPNFRAVGNHDVLCYSFPQNQDYLDNEELFALIGKHNTGSVFGSDTGGYCYRDFEEFKTRVILLNTSDTEGIELEDDTGIYRISGNQLQWFAETLDLSSKSNAQEWNVLFLSHVPLDFQSIRSGTGKILDAYVQGISTAFHWEGTDISYDYSQRNAAAIIANIHGHEHYFSSDYLRFVSQSGVKYRSGVPRVCVPNASFTRSNTDKPVSIAEEPDRKPYVKIADSAESTTFHVVTIDPVARTIHCANYGAGYDRSFTYDTRIQAPEGGYTNLLPSAEALNSSKTTPLDGIGYRSGFCLVPHNLYGTTSRAVMTGAIPYRIPANGLPPTIYIWGGDFINSDHVRFFLLNPYKSRYYLDASGKGISEYFTIDKLGDYYYRLTPVESGETSKLYLATKGAAVRYIAFSMDGYGKEMVVTFDEPIIN